MSCGAANVTVELGIGIACFANVGGGPGLFSGSGCFGVPLMLTATSALHLRSGTSRRMSPVLNTPSGVPTMLAPSRMFCPSHIPGMNLSSSLPGICAFDILGGLKWMYSPNSHMGTIESRPMAILYAVFPEGLTWYLFSALAAWHMSHGIMGCARSISFPILSSKADLNVLATPSNSRMAFSIRPLLSLSPTGLFCIEVLSPCSFLLLMTSFCTSTMLGSWSLLNAILHCCNPAVLRSATILSATHCSSSAPFLSTGYAQIIPVEDSCITRTVILSSVLCLSSSDTSFADTIPRRVKKQ